jgi:hypothetical protein
MFGASGFTVEQRLTLKKYFLVMFWIGQDYSLA